jgi:hypothetical protein
MMRISILPLALLALAQAALAQQAPVAPPAQAAPAPLPADVASPDAIIAAVYDVISGPAGEKRNWDRMRSLFAPGARLIPVGRNPQGQVVMRTLTVEEYVTGVGPRLEEMGFFERELGRVEERYGGIVHRFSSYDSRRKKEDPQPFARGVNSFQLMHDGSRWWIVTIFWQAETPDNPIPPRYLGGK